ncbi:hypothetical protein GCM10010415_25820 [Streptomyces atrovirens]
MSQVSPFLAARSARTGASQRRDAPEAGRAASAGSDAPGTGAITAARDPRGAWCMGVLPVSPHLIVAFRRPLGTWGGRLLRRSDHEGRPEAAQPPGRSSATVPFLAASA